MPAEAVCPHCQLKLRVPANYAGRSVKCAQCQQRFVVQLLADATPAQPSVPAATRLSAAPLPTPVIEELVLSVLEEDEVPEEPANVQIERLAGPSYFWQCPQCTALWRKKALSTESLHATHIKPMARCESCGDAVSYDDVQAGKYDALEVSLRCPHCRQQLSGPAEHLLGRPCPGCGHPLPRQ